MVRLDRSWTCECSESDRRCLQGRFNSLLRRVTSERDDERTAHVRDSRCEDHPPEDGRHGVYAAPQLDDEGAHAAQCEWLPQQRGANEREDEGGCEVVRVDRRLEEQ